MFDKGKSALIEKGKAVLSDSGSAFHHKNLLPGGSASALDPNSAINPSGSVSEMHEVILQGIPLYADIDMSDIYTSPFFISASVFIPGDITDPLTIDRISKLKKLLVF